MVSPARLAANRRNAQRSTGPRTANGIAASSRNATRHGAYAQTPVIPRFEDPDAWDAHLATTLAGLAPVGPFETILVERVALILWRLGRVARYEHEVTNLGHERASSDIIARRTRLDSPDPSANLAAARARLRVLTRAATLPPERPLTGKLANDVLEAVTEPLDGFTLESFSLPDIVPDGPAWDEIPGWTIDRLQRVVRAIAVDQRRDPDSLLTETIARARRQVAVERAALRALERRARDVRRERIIPEAPNLDRVIRYEAHLGRQLAQTLGHLRQLQHARASTARTDEQHPAHDNRPGHIEPSPLLVSLESCPDVPQN